MQSSVYLDRARVWGRTLEEREKNRTGLPLPMARDAVARRTGIAPGTLENLRNGRMKAIAAHFYDRLRSAVVAELESEVARLSHEILLARQAGLDPRDDDFSAAEAALATAKQALEKGLGR